MESQACNGLGASLMALSRQSEALVYFDRALAAGGADPSSQQQEARLLGNRATALMELGRTAEALAAYDSAVEAAEEGDLSAQLNRGFAHRDAPEGQLPQAAEDLLTVLEQMVARKMPKADPAAPVSSERGGWLEEVCNDCVYVLQQLENKATDGTCTAERESNDRRLELVLSLHQRLQRILHQITQAAGTASSHTRSAPGIELADPALVAQLLNPAWARNRTALTAIRGALAAGRPVLIREAFEPELARRVPTVLRLMIFLSARRTTNSRYLGLLFTYFSVARIKKCMINTDATHYWPGYRYRLN